MARSSSQSSKLVANLVYPTWGEINDCHYKLSDHDLLEDASESGQVCDVFPRPEDTMLIFKISLDNFTGKFYLIKTS